MNKELPIIPGRGFGNATATKLRHDYLSSLNLDFSRIAEAKINGDDVRNNIESFIGSVEIPVGVVGPLLYNSDEGQELVYGAVATLEGALVSSMNRGARIIGKSGGFKAQVHHQFMVRSPLFQFSDNNEAEIFSRFSVVKIDQLRQVISEYSNHAQLIDILHIINGNTLHLKFRYTTGDASGQNMTTTCTWHAIMYLAETFKKTYPDINFDYIIEGNGSADKKISAFNIEHGRGIKVKAEIEVPDPVIREVLRTNSDAIYKYFLPSKELAKQENMVGYNINTANAVAAFFAATGQDLASIHESSVAFLDIERTSIGLKFTLEFSNLVIGTVGGGTHLPKQSEALRMMNCLGTGKVRRFAELIAGFALGLEISTYAAIVSGEFARAHEKLGRNKPVNWLLKSELTPSFIQNHLNGHWTDKTIKEIEMVKIEGMDNGIITAITSKISNKLIGFLPLKIHSETVSGSVESKLLLLKSKPLDQEVIKGLHLLAASIDSKLADLLKDYRNNLEYLGTHKRETDIYKLLEAHNYKETPVLFGYHKNDQREIHLLYLELMDRKDMHLFNSENKPENWTNKDIENCIDAISKFHLLSYGHLESIPASVKPFKPWQSAALYRKMLDILLNERNNDDLSGLSEIQPEGLEEEYNKVKMQRCMIHNDFNPRNIMIRNNGEPVIYDWELSVIDLPQRDVCELLCFVLHGDTSADELLNYIYYHYQFYPDVDEMDWIRGYIYSLKSLICTRLSFYEVAGIVAKFDFSKRVLKKAIELLKLLENNA